jgi:hypothetical protein
MLVSMKPGADFSKGCAGRRISHLLFATRPDHGLPYNILGFLPHRLLTTFTAAAICGMNRGNQCPYPPFLSHYYPDTGTGSEYLNRTYVGRLGQPGLNRLRDV